MNLIDAIKSGKPFRRADAPEFYKDAAALMRHVTAVDAFHGVDWAKFLTDESWEIQEPTITVTRTQLRVALRDTYGVFNINAENLLFDRLGMKP
jgi:hypothetical protein